MLSCIRRNVVRLRNSYLSIYLFNVLIFQKLSHLDKVRTFTYKRVKNDESSYDEHNHFASSLLRIVPTKFGLMEYTILDSWCKYYIVGFNPRQTTSIINQMVLLLIFILWLTFTIPKSKRLIKSTYEEFLENLRISNLLYKLKEFSLIHMWRQEVRAGIDIGLREGFGAHVEDSLEHHKFVFYGNRWLVFSKSLKRSRKSVYLYVSGLRLFHILL